LHETVSTDVFEKFARMWIELFTITEHLVRCINSVVEQSMLATNRRCVVRRCTAQNCSKTSRTK